MTTKPAIRRNKENTKQNLILSAKQLFINQGIPSTTIENISQNAGYTRGAFYSTFESKDELIQILMKQEFENLIQTYSQNLLSINLNEYSKRVEPEEVIETIITKIPLDLDFHILRTEFYLYSIRTPNATQPYKDAMRYLQTAFSQILIEYLNKMNLTPTVSISDLADTIIGIINIAMHNIRVITNPQEPKSKLTTNMFPRILKATTKELFE